MIRSSFNNNAGTMKAGAISCIDKKVETANISSRQGGTVPGHLFVYGSLLPELAPAILREALRQLSPLGRASVPGRLHDLGSYPGAVFDVSASSRVIGQAFALPPESNLLACLDAYEGLDPTDLAASLYARRAHPVDLDSGAELLCWMYVYQGDATRMPLIREGDYLAWRTGRDRTG